MSIATLNVRNHISEIRERLGISSYFREHSHEIIISVIMVGITLGLAGVSILTGHNLNASRGH